MLTRATEITLAEAHKAAYQLKTYDMEDDGTWWSYQCETLSFYSLSSLASRGTSLRLDKNNARKSVKTCQTATMAVPDMSKMSEEEKRELAACKNYWANPPSATDEELFASGGVP